MLAVVVKGNPKFIKTTLAVNYYNEIAKFLKHIGYTVEFDAGKDYTRPRQDADLYIGHSRGVDRYNFMEKENKSKFLKFGALEGYIHPVDAAWQKVTPPGTGTPPPEHFWFTEEQKNAIIKKTAELSTESNSVAETLVAEAMNERFLGPKSLDKHMENLTLINYKGQVVGFHVPFQESDGVWRVGSIYLRPNVRGKGIAVELIREFIKNRRTRAWIEPGNANSIRAFTAAGMVKSDRRLTVSSKPFEEYISFQESFERKMLILSAI